ncbi:conjugative transposon protein TraN [Sphingobacterium siyangense]|uniref:conjugative transposon protein TraN n=1 Tax=Sphingobacterium siyangense TaxID=459529 RepID=UPI00289E60B4|nr:conjugative transposon protein TraN [Sphingobacterium siyangense]
MKKQTKLILLLLMFAISSFAQSQNSVNLPVVFVSNTSTVHFVSPEPIQYVDISTNNFVGEIAVENILSIKYNPTQPDSSKSKLTIQAPCDAVVTVIGQSFYAQYRLSYITETQYTSAASSIEILPDAMRALEFPENTLSKTEMKNLSLDMLKRRRSFFNVSTKKDKMLVHLNNIYAFGNYIFVDISFKNTTKIKYDIDEFRFNIKDKRITKATNIQDIEITPVFTLYDQPYFKKNYRNIFVFKKFTFPNDKILSLQMTEKQISGRTIELKIDYRDLLNADTL